MAVNLGDITLSSQKPHLAASFWCLEQVDSLATWQSLGLDIAEIRLDLLTPLSLSLATELCRSLMNFPSILTVRSAFEGGRWQQDEKTRYQYLAHHIDYVQAVDIELSAGDILPSVIAMARAKDKILIVSHHNFSAPDNFDSLTGVIEQAIAIGADVVKCACLCQSARDCRRLVAAIDYCLQHDLTCIIIGMDDGSDNAYARWARLQLPFLGSSLAFASLGDNHQVSALGQLPLSVMSDYWRSSGLARAI